VLVEWETGEFPYEPLDLIGTDNPVTCAEYAMKRGLLGTPGWKRFNRYAKNQKKLKSMMNQAKMKSYRREPFWKVVVIVPQTHAKAVEIYLKNTAWQDAEATEMRQFLEYNTFIDIGKESTAPTGYKRI
jgi:hypothetical protein